MGQESGAKRGQATAGCRKRSVPASASSSTGRPMGSVNLRRMWPKLAPAYTGTFSGGRCVETSVQPGTYQGHHADGSGVQKHSAGGAYPYVLQLRDKPAGG